MDLGIVQQVLAQVGEIALHGRLAVEAAMQGDVGAVLEHALEAVGLAQGLGG